MSGHAHLAPSSAHRWVVCPGSPRLAARVPDSGGAPADQGSACHLVLRDCLEVGGDATGLVGHKVRVVDEALDRVAEVDFTAEMAKWVNEAASWVRALLESRPGSTLYCERKARVGHALGIPDDLWGTADVAVADPGRRELVVADAKFGYVEVEVEQEGETPPDLLSDEPDAPVEHNEQLLLYAIGLMEQWAWAFDSVRIAILQPRSAVPVKVAVVQASLLRAKAAWFRERALAALAPDAPLVVSEEGCRFCPAAGVCPALQARALELARREFDDPATLRPEQLVELVRARRRIEAGLKAAAAHATRLLALGVKLPGLKRVRPNTHRRWLNDEVARAAMIEDCGLLEKDVEKRKLLSPNQAEELVGKRDYKAKLEAWTEKPLGEPVAAPEEDKREEVEPDFTEVVAS